MKKLLFILLLSFASSAIYAQQLPIQVRANDPTAVLYDNGDSYGYYIAEVPGAVSYEWSFAGAAGGAKIWPAWDTAIDVTYSKPGDYDIICTVTMSDGSVVTYPYLTVHVQDYD